MEIRHYKMTKKKKKKTTNNHSQSLLKSCSYENINSPQIYE